MTLTVLAIDPPKWTEVGGFWVGLAAAVGTIGTVFAALWIALHGDKVAQRRLKEERELADKRLADQAATARRQLEEEREIAERRIVEERAFAAAERLHERQASAAAVLLEYIGRLVPLMRNVPSVTLRAVENADLEVRNRINDLARGAFVEALMLGDFELTARYRKLAHLVHSASMEPIASTSRAARMAGDLRNYAKFVRLSLQALVDGEPLPDPGADAYPHLGRTLDNAQWHPTNIPVGWDEEASLDPNDPQFRTHR